MAVSSPVDPAVSVSKTASYWMLDIPAVIRPVIVALTLIAAVVEKGWARGGGAVGKGGDNFRNCQFPNGEKGKGGGPSHFKSAGLAPAVGRPAGLPLPPRSFVLIWIIDGTVHSRDKQVTLHPQPGPVWSREREREAKKIQR